MIRYIARSPLGKNRVFWCVWDDSLFAGEPPIAHGYEPSVEAAETKAREVAGEEASGMGAGWARNAHRQIVAERRRNRPAKAANTHKVEYVYNYGNQSGVIYPNAPPPETTAYRVHKTTKTRLYVEYEPCLIERIELGLYHDHELRTFVLDRQEFEREGHAGSRSQHGDFWSTPEAAIRGHVSCRGSLPTNVAEAVARLDLDESVIDEGKLKTAYRKKALNVHPDQGGNAVDFLQLQTDCETIQRHFGYCG
jgi:hypothetical protein